MNYEKSGDRKGLKWPQTTFTSVLPKLTSSNDPCKTGGLLCTKDRTHKVHQRDFYVEREATSLHTQNPGDVSRAPSQKQNKQKKKPGVPQHTRCSAPTNEEDWHLQNTWNGAGNVGSGSSSTPAPPATMWG